MSSILTNTSAMSAIASLAAIQQSLGKVQKQVATGLAVNDASDNPAVWSIATSMRSDVSALNAVSSSIALGGSILGTATPAMTSVLNLLQSLKSQFSQINSPAGGTISASTGNTLTSIQSGISAIQQSIIAVMGSTASGGVNMLDGSQATVTIVDSYARNANGTNYGSLNIASSTTALGGTSTSAPSGTTGGGGMLGATIGASTAAGQAGSTSSSTAGATTTYAGTFTADSLLGFQLTASTSSADFTKISQALDVAITKVTGAAAQLGSYTTVLNNQSTAISSLTNTITTGIGSLVDADMNAASSRLQALQVQQQLAIQALSLANSNSQAILKLFGG